MTSPIRRTSSLHLFLTTTPGFQLAENGSGGRMEETPCVFNEEFKFLLLPVSYGTVFVVGLLLNSRALWLFLFRMRPWNAATTFMFHLALSDTLYLLSLPTLVYYYAERNNWQFGKWLCKAVRFLFYANLYSSILFLTCISILRYLGICHPICALKWVKSRHAHRVCLSVWLAVATCLVPNMVFVTISARGNGTLCHDTTRPEEFDHYVHYSSAIMALLFALPFLVVVVCYCQMAKQLWSPGQTLPSYKRCSIKTILVILLVFAISFLPFHITRTIYYTSRHLRASCYTLNVVNIAYKVMRPLARANSCIDPVLYFLAGNLYRGRVYRAPIKTPKSKQASSTLTLASQFREDPLHPQRGNSSGLEGVNPNTGPTFFLGCQSHVLGRLYRSE